MLLVLIIFLLISIVTVGWNPDTVLNDRMSRLTNIQKLEQKISRDMERKVQLEQELEQLQEKLRIANDQHTEIQRESKARSLSLTGKEKTYKELVQTIDLKGQELAALNLELTAAGMKRNEEAQVIKDQESQLKELEAQSKLRKASVENHKSESKSLQETINKLRDEQKREQDKMNVVKQELDGLREQKDRTREILNLMESKTDRLKNMEKGQQETMGSHTRNLYEMTQKVRQIADELKEKDEQMQEKNNAISELDGRISYLESFSKKLEQKRNNIQKEMRLIERDLEMKKGYVVNMTRVAATRNRKAVAERMNQGQRRRHSDESPAGITNQNAPNMQIEQKQMRQSDDATDIENESVRDIESQRVITPQTRGMFSRAANVIKSMVGTG